MENKTEHLSSVDQEGKLVFFEKKKSHVPTSGGEVKSLGKKIKYHTWGKDNLYPQWLNKLFKESAIHSGIIRAKVHFTVSGGLNYDPVDENDLVDRGKWELMFNNGRSDYDLNEVTEHASLDLEIGNKFIFAGKWNLNFTAVEKIELIDFETARKEVGSGDLLVSRNWGDKNPSYKRYQLLNLKLKGSKAIDGERRNRWFYIEYEERSKQSKQDGKLKVSQGIYPDPPYSGGIKSICTGLEIDEYQNAEINNNFALGTIVNLNNGKPKNEQDRKNTEKGLRDATTGATNAGGIWLSYNNGKGREATVVHLNGNDLNNRYIELNKDTQKNILRAHSVTVPILFGFKEEGSLGNATELETGYAIMKANYFRRRQNAILAVLNFIGEKCNGLQGKIYFNEVSLDLPKENKEPSVVIDQRRLEQSKEDNKDDQEKEERLIKQLSLSGVSRGKKMILFRKEMKDLEKCSEISLIEEFKKEKFQGLSDIQNQVLNLVGEGNGFDSIKTALEVKAIELAGIYQKLINGGYLNKDGGLTELGATEVVRADIEKMKILYSYEERLDAPELVEGGKSRDFCVKLLDLNRLYTREEIDQISSIEGYDVFSYRGGWYHNPDTDKNTPWCRHTWVQNVVFG